VFGLHHFAHAHNAEVGTDSLAGMTAKSMKATATTATTAERSGK
jgi:enoyl-CoA hydratase